MSKPKRKTFVPPIGDGRQDAELLIKAFRAASAGGDPGAVSGGVAPAVAARLGCGGAMGNTPPASSQLGIVGEDTAHISVWSEYGPDKRDFFRRVKATKAESGKKAAEYVPPSDDDDTDGDDESFIPPGFKMVPDDNESGVSTSDRGGPRWMDSGSTMEFGDALWHVSAKGLGGNDGRAYYPYVLRAGGITLAFREKQAETVSNMWVEFGSIALAQHGGLAGCWTMFKEMMRREGMHVMKNILSRVDMYLDTDLAPVDEFCRKIENGSKVCRARSMAYYSDELNTSLHLMGKKYTGFSMGRNIKLRVYDKRLELEKDPIKWSIFAQRYGGIPLTLTRVEFQLRRQAALSNMVLESGQTVDTVDDYLNNWQSLWSYLTDDWFRFTDRPVNKRNHDQAKIGTWAIWTAIAKTAGVAREKLFRVKERITADFDHLLSMALGCVVKASIWQRRDMTGIDVLDTLWDYIERVGEAKIRDVFNKHGDDVLLEIGYFESLTAS